jgi:hypothetical protein
MTDRPASWRMPTPKQMEKLAAEAAGKSANTAPAPNESLPPEYWDSVLKTLVPAQPTPRRRQRRLSEISRHVLRVSCRRCERTVEIQTVDAVRLYGGDAKTTPVSSAPADTKKTGASQVSRQLKTDCRSDLSALGCPEWSRNINLRPFRCRPQSTDSA